MPAELFHLASVIADLKSTDKSKRDKAKRYVLALVESTLDVNPDSAALIYLSSSREF